MPPKEQLVENDDATPENDDVEIVVEGEEEKEAEVKTKSSESEEAPAKKEAKTEDDEDEEDDADDEENEEELRERRRREKLARKERKEKAIARDKLEMSFLRQRNEELEKRMRAQELRSSRQDHYTLEQQIEEAEERARMAEQVIAKAIAEANGDDATRAIKIRDEALEKIRQLHQYRDKMSQTAQKQPEKSSIDPLVASHAQAWMAKNEWYNPQGGDLDSRIVLAIDQSLVDEGYVPKTTQYWRELDRRVRAKLPHRFNDEHTLDEDENSSSTRKRTNPKRSASHEADDDDEYVRPSQSNRIKKGPPVGQQSESGMGAKKKEIYISKDRKEALIQAGVWDDPVLRMRYVKRYQDWDKENSSR